MVKPKVFVTRKILEEGMKMITQDCDAVVWQDELPPPHSELIKRAKGMDGLLCLLTDNIDQEVIESAGENLKVISNHAVGFDNIDIATASSRGIPVGNTPGILTDATADFAFTLLLSCARRVIEADRYVRKGLWQTWSPDQLLGADISGTTLGIIGFGRIGQAMVKRAAGFDMKILFHDPEFLGDFSNRNVCKVDLDTLLGSSDFISIHTPLNEQTRHMINTDAINKMKPTAILINTARGAVVDPDALYHALKNKRIRSAALDVTDPEPITMQNQLLELDNLLISPHIASASVSTRNRMSIMAAENLIAGVQGKRLPNCVNPEIYS
ncbi:MAG TPA: D-glycerate dehydrogenase [Anaerolineales bacterium]|nr:D-glycerate dehydrogenase [Anaerolineales bacterium]